MVSNFLTYKIEVTIHNKLDHHSRVINYTPRVVNLVSIMLLENIYSTGVTHDDCNLRLAYFYSTVACIVNVL
jgi:hypothetical protein